MYNITMKDLNEKEKEINDKFNMCVKQRDQLQTQLNQVTNEIVLLQGEYRLIQSMKETEDDENPEDKQDEAMVQNPNQTDELPTNDK